MAKVIKETGNRVMSITDKDGQYFTRAWPTFESSLAIKHGLWYIYTAHDSKHHNGAVGLISGGATSDLHAVDTSNREIHFPTSLIVKCITEHNLKNVLAEKEVDRIHVLNSIIGTDLDAEPPEVDDKYDVAYNNAFRAHFATPGTLKTALLLNNGSWQKMLSVLSKGKMKMIRFDFEEGRGWDEMTSDDATALMNNLPRTIKHLTIRCGNFGAQFVRALGVFVTESEVEEIYLEDTLVNNFVDDVTMKLFAKALKENTSLKNIQVWRANQENELKVWEEDVKIIETLAQSDSVAKLLFAPLDRLYTENLDYAKITFLLTLFTRMNIDFSEYVSKKQVRLTLEWVQALNASKRAVLLKSEAGSYVKHILNSEFTLGQNLGVVMFDLYIQLTIVFLLSSTVNGKNSVMGTSFVQPLLLSICLIWILFRELMQSHTTCARLYFTETTNWIDTVQIILLFCIATGLYDNIDHDLSRTVYACAIISSWLALIFDLSDLHYQLAVFVTSVDKIIKGLIPFLFATSLLTIMFAHAYRAMYVEETCTEIDNSTLTNEWLSCSTISQSYMQALRMFLSGDFDY